MGITFLSESFTAVRNQINHRDCDVANYELSNLEWVSQSENNVNAMVAFISGLA